MTDLEMQSQPVRLRQLGHMDPVYLLRLPTLDKVGSWAYGWECSGCGRRVVRLPGGLLADEPTAADRANVHYTRCRWHGGELTQDTQVIPEDTDEQPKPGLASLFELTEDEEAARVLARQVERAAAETARVDAKAGQLLGVLGLLGIAAGLAKLSGPPAWIGAVLSAVALVLLLVALWPRLGTHPAAVRAQMEVSEMLDAARTPVPSVELAVQVKALSRILVVKYALIEIATTCLLLATGCAVAAVMDR